MTDYPLSPLPMSSRLRSIDILRGLAILSVLAIHIPHDAPGGWRNHLFFFPAFLADFGYLGVPLFIVISGFCIHRGAAASKRNSKGYSFSWAQFWKRRFFRLYPPYAAAVLLTLGCALFLHTRFKVESNSFFLLDLVTHLTLVHNLTQEFSTSLGNGAFWSLGTEEQLYGLYFFLLILLTYRSYRFALIVAGGLTLVWRLGVANLTDYGIDARYFHLGSWYQWPFYYWLHWTLGAVAVEAHLGNISLPKWSRSVVLSGIFIVIGISLNLNTFEMLARTQLSLPLLKYAGDAMLARLHGMGELILLLGFFCLLNWGLQMEMKGRLNNVVSASIARIGKISYSLYLVHVPVIYVLEEWIPFGYAPLEWISRYMIYGIATLFAGFIFYIAIEQWFLAGKFPRVRERSAAVVALH